MATTTPNFGWTVPTSTDLVKDGATAIETLGDGIDASFVDLKGGTTGQVLSKASGTDLDFTWVAQDDSNAIQNAIVDAKGDLIAATGADTPARLAVGTNGQVLTADSTASTGLAWATASSGGLTSIASGTLSSTQVSITSIPGTYKYIYLVTNGATSGSNFDMWITVNSLTSSSYYRVFTGAYAGTGYSSLGATSTSFPAIGFPGIGSGVAANNNSMEVEFMNYANASNNKLVRMESTFLDAGSSNSVITGTGRILTNSAITSIQINASTSFTAGTYVLYGAN
jgi:hypothetical protein